MKKTLVFALVLILSGCGKAADKTKPPAGDPPAKRISDFKRLTLLEIIRATEDPIRADLEARLEFWQSKETPPDKVTFRMFYEMYGQEAVNLCNNFNQHNIGSVGRETLDDFFRKALLGLIDYAKQKKSVPSKVAIEFFKARIEVEKKAYSDRENHVPGNDYYKTMCEIDK